MEQRRGNVSEVWAWLGSYDIGQDYAGRLFGDVQVAVMPKVIEHTPDELNGLVRTMSFYARLSPGQRQALEREYGAIYERLGRPIRASTVAALVTARRSTEGDDHRTSPQEIGEGGRAPGQGRAPLPEGRQGADGMRADKAQRSGNQDHARVPISRAQPAADRISVLIC